MNKLIHKQDNKYPDTHLDLRNSENNLQIDITWEGCAHISMLSNGVTFDSPCEDQIKERDYVHICDLAEFIEQLQEAYNRAKEKGFEV